MSEFEEETYSNQKVEEWVIEKADEWREHYNQNYRESHEEYYRLWRGIWDKSDTLRNSERSRIITPALQQAVESSVAEVEEATFGRGNWFDIEDDAADEENQDIASLKKQLNEDMQFAKARSSISEVLLNSAVFGTGIGEIYLDETVEYTPATQPALDGQMTAVGVIEKERFMVKLRPILPQNFLIDPLATDVETALGCAVDMFVPQHQVQMDIDSGVYRDVDIGSVPSDSDLEPDNEITDNNSDRVRLTKYYGLVPTELFKEAMAEDEDDEFEELGEEEEGSYIEAIIVIANGETLLKIEKNPNMMHDRPIVTFQWDNVPSRFWGRGVCEKGYNSQKALDTELRARIDALALTVHPMMAVDASRMPRGAKYEIRPGKTFLTNGNPAEILQPFNFGAIDQVTFAQGAQLQQMVQQATGAVDSTSFANAAANGEATSGGISMSLGAVIKRHKRTLLNFQENFLIPFVSKAAWRYMQFEPELYKAQDFKFVVSSSLGIIAREYEVTQLVQLLQTMGQDSPLYPLLVESVVESMNLTNREQILAAIKETNKPDEAAQEEAAIRKQFEQALAEAQLGKIAAETQEIQSRIEQNTVETQLLPIEEETRRISAMSNSGQTTSPEDKEFDKQMEIAELRIKERNVEIQEKNANIQAILAQASASEKLN